MGALMRMMLTGMNTDNVMGLVVSTVLALDIAVMYCAIKVCMVLALHAALQTGLVSSAILQSNDDCRKIDTRNRVIFR